MQVRHGDGLPLQGKIILWDVTVGVAHGYYGSGLQPELLHKEDYCFSFIKASTRPGAARVEFDATLSELMIQTDYPG